MKQALGMRFGQHTALTPQLHQAIKLMQLSAAELRQEVREAVESNPMLELVEDGDDSGEGDHAENAEPTPDEAQPEDGYPEADPGAASDPVDAAAEHAGAEDAAAEYADGEPLETIPEDLPVDVSWDDVYQSPAAGAAGPGVEEAGFEERSAGGATLRDHLRWQLDLTPMSERDRLIALVLVDSIDANGMLEDSPRALLAAFDADLAVELPEVETVLKLVQRFDPPGVGARNIRECLLLQLEQLAPDTPWRDEAAAVVRGHFELLAGREFGALSRRAQLPEAALVAAMTLIRSLHPRPGAAIGDNEAEYVEPDVVVRRQEGRWTVELNPRLAPRVRVHAGYAGLVKRGDRSSQNRYLQENLQDAKWFLKNLEYRNETLLKVAAEIVDRQRGFLERGPEAMQPLVLADVAAAVDRHESTISRATTRKFMETPRGVFELKYFFSSHVGGLGGGEVSSTAIRALIRKLVAAEAPQRPLSDSRIAAMLKERHIDIARRTVAKYRESLAIPTSNERRRLV